MVIPVLQMKKTEAQRGGQLKVAQFKLHLFAPSSLLTLQLLESRNSIFAFQELEMGRKEATQ